MGIFLGGSAVDREYRQIVDAAARFWNENALVDQQKNCRPARSTVIAITEQLAKTEPPTEILDHVEDKSELSVVTHAAGPQDPLGIFVGTVGRFALGHKTDVVDRTECRRAVLVLAEEAFSSDAIHQVIHHGRFASMFDRDGYGFTVVKDDAVVADMFAPVSVSVAIKKHRELGEDRSHVLADLEHLRNPAFEVALVVDHCFLENRETSQCLAMHGRRFTNRALGDRLVPELGFSHGSYDGSALFRHLSCRLGHFPKSSSPARTYVSFGLQACSKSLGQPGETQCVWKPDVQNALGPLKQNEIEIYIYDIPGGLHPIQVEITSCICLSSSCMGSFNHWQRLYGTTVCCKDTMAKKLAIAIPQQHMVTRLKLKVTVYGRWRQAKTGRITLSPYLRPERVTYPVLAQENRELLTKSGAVDFRAHLITFVVT